MDKEADPEKKQRHQYPFRLSGKGFESARKRKKRESNGHHDCEQKQLFRHRRVFRPQNPLMSSGKPWRETVGSPAHPNDHED